MKPNSLTLPQVTLDAIQTPFAIKNSHGVILSCNQSFKDLNQLGAKNLIGLTAHDFLPRLEADIYAKADNDLLENPRGYLNFQLELQKSSELNLTFQVHKSLAHTDSGNSEILVVINRVLAPSGARNNYLLSPRESSVLELLIQGNSQKNIAATLGISHHTVAEYLKAIYFKLGVNNRTQAQLKGIIELGLGFK